MSDRYCSLHFFRLVPRRYFLHALPLALSGLVDTIVVVSEIGNPSIMGLVHGPRCTAVDRKGINTLKTTYGSIGFTGVGSAARRVPRVCGKIYCRVLLTRLATRSISDANVATTSAFYRLSSPQYKEKSMTSSTLNR